MTEIQVVLDGRALPPWTATPGSSELQEIPGVEGATVSFVTIYGILEPGDFFGVLEVSGGQCHGMVSHRVSRVDREVTGGYTVQFSHSVLRGRFRIKRTRYTSTFVGWRSESERVFCAEEFSSVDSSVGISVCMLFGRMLRQRYAYFGMTVLVRIRFISLAQVTGMY